MPRGRVRSRGRGRGGRGRGSAYNAEDSSVEKKDTALSYSPKCGRGRGRGRRRAASLEHPASEDPSSPSSTNVQPQQQQQHSLMLSPVMVVVPQGRMITRSLLRSASSLLLDELAESQRQASLISVGERRKRARATLTTGTAVADASLAPSLSEQRHYLPANASLSMVPVASSPPLSSSISTVATTSTVTVPGSPPPPPHRVIVGGLLRCVCDAFLVSPHETLLECSRCRNWSHPACVGVEGDDLRRHQRQHSYVCPFCAPLSPYGNADEVQGGGAHARANYAGAFPAEPLPQLPQSPASVTTSTGENIPVVCSPSSPGPPPLSNTFAGSTEAVNDVDGSVYTPPQASVASPIIAGVATASPASSSFPLVSRQPPASKQLPQKLRDVPDSRPPAALAQRLEDYLRSVEKTANELGYSVLHLPAYQLTDAQLEESLACCTEAIREATFSADYPAYCLKEVQQRRHPYVQGTALQSKDDGTICSFVLSNGRDLYGNIKSTITQMKSALHRGFLASVDVTDFMAHCMTITDVSDFVHITLSATHAKHQRRGLAQLLMAMELLKWALRGRTRAFLNMAIEKHLVDGGTRIEFASPVASRRLYGSFGFMDVFPRYDPITKKERWTAKEADMGRVMANLSFVEDVQRVAAALPAKYHAHHRSRHSSDGNSILNGRVNTESANTPIGTAAFTPKTTEKHTG